MPPGTRDGIPAALLRLRRNRTASIACWARARFTIVTLSALFMCWFYWFWNILGFQYF